MYHTCGLKKVVVVSSIKLGWHWKGDVKADGSLVEVSAFRQMSEEESQNLARCFRCFTCLNLITDHLIKEELK